MPPDSQLAHALHDGVVQRLAGVAAVLESADELASGDRERCVAELKTAIAELRAVIETGAAIPGDGGTDLEQLIRDFVVEGIRNAEKHAKPRVIAFSGYVSNDRIRLEVLNDGVPGTTRGTGARLGLRLLGGEALRHGGSVDVQPLEPDGWCAALTLPREER